MSQVRRFFEQIKPRKALGFRPVGFCHGPGFRRGVSRYTGVFRKRWQGILLRSMIRFSFHPFEGWQLVAARELRNGQIAFSCSPSAWQEEVHALLATFCFTVGTTDDDMNVTESSTSGDPARIDDDVILRVVRDIAHGERLRMSR